VIKVRFITWYWGNFCLATKKESEALPKGFEIYNEDLHGWKNSEEWKERKKEQFKNEFDSYLKDFMNSSYYQSWLKDNG
jgi:hypothetical protein